MLINEAIESGASLSKAFERQEMLDKVNLEKFASMPPYQIVPTLANQGTYIAQSVHSTVYCMKKKCKIIVVEARSRINM